MNCQAKGCTAPATYTQRVRNATTDRVVRLCADCWTALMTPYRPDPELEEEKADVRGPANRAGLSVSVPPMQTPPGSDAESGKAPM